MQFYLHHYILYIFSSSTLPIINFLGVVHTKKEHTFFVYSIRTRVREHMFVFTHAHTVVTCKPLIFFKSCEKAAFRSCKGSCVAFSRAQKKLRFISASEKLRFRRFSPGCARNLTKKFKFFQKKLQKFKKN